MLKKTGKQYVHKKSGSCNFFSVDHHGCITSQVRTFFSSGIWDEIDPTCFINYPVLEVPIDIALHDRGLDMRAYQHSDSGVILLEMNLYDYENEKPDFSKSAFREFNEDIREREYTEAAYDITAKTYFVLMGMDDCGRWCNGFIYVPAGTGFVCSFDKGFYPKGYRGPQTPIAWPMIHLTNSQIGIEIMFPAKYTNDVFEFSKETRVNIARRAMTGMIQVNSLTKITN